MKLTMHIKLYAQENGGQEDLLENCNQYVTHGHCNYFLQASLELYEVAWASIIEIIERNTRVTTNEGINGI